MIFETFTDLLLLIVGSYPGAFMMCAGLVACCFAAFYSMALNDN